MCRAAISCACILAACGGRGPPAPGDGGAGDGGAAATPCASVLDCRAGEACIHGFCEAALPDGAACRGHGDCAAPTPFCSAGACVQCLGEVDCESGMQCVASACVPRGDGGADADAGPDAGDAGGDAAGDASSDAASDAGPDPADEGRACTGPGTCPVGYRCITQRSGGAFCRLPCDPYAPSCAEERRCAWTGFDAGRVAGACVPPQQGHALGEACASDDPCAVELVCVRDAAAESHCRALCDPAPGAPAGDCASPNACQAIPLGDGLFLGSCFPDTTFLDPCGHSSECGADLVCSVGSFPADPYGLANQCDWTLGASSTADPCTAPDQCDTGVCLSLWHSCYGACRTEPDCPQAPQRTACVEIGFQSQSPSGPVTSALPSCVPECRSDLACGTGVCGVFLNHEGNGFAAVCVPKSVGAGTVGAGGRCDADADCLSGACLGGGAPVTDGLCLGVCAEDADCLGGTACPADGVLLSVGNGELAPAPICWGKNCTSNADCAGQSLDPSRPRVCTAFLNPNDRKDIALACYPRAGTKAAGASCTTSAECASDWCVSWLGSICFGACAGNTDCAGGTVCRTFDWGNPQSCSSDAQCPRPQICSNYACSHLVQMCAP